MIDLIKKKERAMGLIEQLFASLKAYVSYMLLPLAVPLLFVQETISLLKELAGFKKRSLEGKVVLITGASSGIGASLAKYFYLAGSRLILMSRRLPELEKVKTELVRLKTEGPVHVPAVLHIDMSDLESIGEKAEEVLSIFGSVDILINNAGLSVRGSVLDTDIQVYEKIMKVNYFGPIILTKKLLPQMIKRGNGSLVFISSVQGRFSIPDRSAYGGSKHALQSFADSLRAEIGETGVQVTVVSPGYVKTNLSINALTGGGTTYGLMDASTASGLDPDYVAQRTLRAVIKNEKEILLIGPLLKIVLFIRYLIPNLFFNLMARRAASSTSKKTT